MINAEIRALYAREDAASQPAAPVTQVVTNVLLVGGGDAAAFDDMLSEIAGGAFQLRHAPTLKAGLSLLGSGRFDIAFIDTEIGTEAGVDLIRAAGGRLCPTPMVLLAPAVDIEIEQAGIGAGAVDLVESADLSPSVLRRVIRYARFNHETTRRLIVEEQRYREVAATASAASGEKTKFLAQMSHELRTPLNAILGFSEVIRNEMFGAIEGIGAHRYLEYIGDIHDSSRHLLSLINDLLDLSKIEAGKFEIAPADVVLADVFEDVRRMGQQLARDKGVALHIESPTCQMEIFADRRLVMQAILNVVANAVKFTPAGGSVTLDARGEGQNLVITVTDTGQGISAEDLPFVIEPFQQAGHLETRQQGGTGLGLPLARSIMELHQGGLEIASELGVGTSVAIWLPRKVCLASAGGV